MVKLTVMYNLPPEADHEVFIKWRTTEHQKENMEIPGVIKSDFYIVKEVMAAKRCAIPIYHRGVLAGYGDF